MGIINITIFKLFLAFLLPLIIMFISKGMDLGKEREIFKTSIKMMIQLFILGYVLVFLLDKLPNYIGSLYIFVMLFFAYNVLKSRVKKEYRKDLKRGYIALCVGSLVVLFYFVFLIIQPNPLLSPQYLIPIYGMILGNSVTSIVLGITTFNDSLENDRLKVNTLINLGVPPSVAINGIFQKTILSALTPTLTTMSGIGLIALPGMMTGQILSGTDPIIAVKYQMSIMFIILGSVGICNFVFLNLMKKDIVNKYNQLTR